MILAHSTLRAAFASTGQWPANDEPEPPLQTSRQSFVLAARFDLGPVTTQESSRHLILAYDDQFSIQYFHRNLRPYWKRKGMTTAEMLTAAAHDLPALSDRAAKFDAEFTADLTKTGGVKYAQIATLAYRQALAAHKLVADLDDTPLFFSKENFSNGCIATVDVTYPSAPLFLLLHPALMKGMTTSLDYTLLPRWAFHPGAPSVLTLLVQPAV